MSGLERALGVVVAVLAVGCSGDAVDTGDPAGDPAGCAGYEAAGGFAVGVTTLDMAGVPVEVWYPAAPGSTEGLEREVYDMRQWLPPAEAAKISDADTPLFTMDAYRDVDAAEGAYALVLFSHGMGGYRMQSSFLMTHLASWGFVVVAPEHPERGLAQLVETGAPTGDDAPQAMRAAYELMVGEAGRAGGRFEGRIDLDKVAVTGHSMGGGAVLSVATEDYVDTWITYASGGFGSSRDLPQIPSFMMAGTNDGVAGFETIENAFARQAPGKRYLGIDRMGHLGFSDLCAVGADRGGVLQIAIDSGVEVPDILMQLGNDGCGEMDLAPQAGWDVINHYTTAHLKQVFAVNLEPVGLEDGDVSCFGDRVANYLHD